MKIFLLILLNIIFFRNISCQGSCKHNTGPILIVIAVDGFKREYLERGVTPNLLQFRRNGVYTESLGTYVFSNALQSLHTMATGYNSRKHGIPGHAFFGNKTTIDFYNARVYNYNKKIVPIWIHNQINGGMSGCIMWPGCEFKYADEYINFMMPYNSTITVMKRFETAVQWLNSSIKPNLVMIYVDEPDRQGHIYGPNSPQVTKIIEDIDEAHGYLNKKLFELRLHKRVHIIYVSDHGMEPVTKMCDLSTLKICEKEEGLGKLRHLNALNVENPGFKTPCLNHLIKEFTRTRVFREPFREVHDNFEGNSIFVTPKGHAWLAYMKKYIENRIDVGVNHPYGAHGYVNFKDSPIFMAQGRLFKKGLVNTFLDQVDLHSLFTYILKIPDKHDRDSNFTRVRPLLRISEMEELVSWTRVFIAIAVLAASSCVIFYYVVNNANEKIKKRQQKNVPRT